MALIQGYCFSSDKFFNLNDPYDVARFEALLRDQLTNKVFFLMINGQNDQEKFETLIQNQEIKDLTIARSAYWIQIDLSSLSRLNNLEKLTLDGDFGSFRTNPNILWTLPGIPSLKHLAISGFNFSKENSDKLPDWLSRNPQLESLDLTSSSFDDPDTLATLIELKNLKKLNLSNNYLGLFFSFNLSMLHNFPSLISLDVRKNSSLSSPTHLSLILNIPKLEELYIGGRTHAAPDNIFLSSHLYEQNFHTLTTSNTLKTLVFENVITDSLDFSHLAPNLEHLGLINVTGSIDWRKLQNNLKLKTLEISDITWDASKLELINLSTFEFLKKFTSNSAKGINISHLMPNVEELYLAGSNITGGDLKKIGQLHSLIILDISYIKSLNGTSLTHLKNLTNLKKLSLNALALSTGDFKHLKNLPALEELSLSGSTLALSQLDSLGEMTSLKRLDLYHVNNPNITSTEIHALQQKLPHTKIISEFLNNS